MDDFIIWITYFFTVTAFFLAILSFGNTLKFSSELRLFGEQQNKETKGEKRES